MWSIERFHTLSTARARVKAPEAGGWLGRAWLCCWKAALNPNDNIIHRNRIHIISWVNIRGVFAKVGLFYIHSGNKFSDKGNPEITLSRPVRISETYHNTLYFSCRAPTVGQKRVAEGILKDLSWSWDICRHLYISAGICGYLQSPLDNHRYFLKGI